MAAQHVIDQIGRNRDLPPGLFLAGMALVDQAGNHGAIAEGALQQEAFVQPGFQIVAQHVLVEEHAERRVAHLESEAHVLQRPDASA